MTEREIFVEAFQRPDPADRRQFLDQACGADQQLRRRIENLLRLAEPTGTYFPTSLVERVAAVAFGPRPVPEPGTVVAGRYKLLELIGEGGMGAVWMAEQTEPVRRRVAVKFVRPGMESRQVVARFEAERQALALMDHPNIARVFDGGVTPEDQPYFVMELVKGVPITKFCDENGLTPRERLELFVPVCQAVQHAHQKGVIHRDLKPSNVLIALYDGVPVPKVIDFGVAKAAGEPLTGRTLFTGFGTVIGTPEYMSPEQAELNNADIDTRTDVYSLGVLLYEMLTGTTPLDRTRLQQSGLLDVLRVIREEEPPRPSARVSQRSNTARGVHNDPAGGRSGPCFPQFRELDWIVMKCLEKNRNRRYPTANALASDLRRYLADEPVQACPPSAAYRLGKLVRRNKVVVTAAAVLVAVLVAATAVSSWLAVRATRAEGLADRRLNAERDERERAVRAEREAKRRQFAARIAQARASRRSGQSGRRFDALAAVTEAARLARELQVGPDELIELRNEAVAALALTDLRLDRVWPGYPPGTGTTGIAFDADVEHYARVGADGHVTVRRLDDNREVVRITDVGAPTPRVPDWRVSLRFSPDRKQLATTGNSRSRSRVPLKVWNLDGPECVFEGPADVAVRDGCLDYRPDGRELAVGSRDGFVHVFDIAARAERARFRVGAGLGRVRFHPFGHRLAACRGSEVLVLDAATGAVVRTLDHPGSEVCAVAWSADGRRLAVGCDDRLVYVWDADVEEPPVLCKGHQRAVLHVAFNRRGDRLASTGYDGTTRLWDPRTGDPLLTVEGHAGDFSRDGRWLSFGSEGSSVGRWEAGGGREFRRLCDRAVAPAVGCVDFGLDGRLLASADGGAVRLWDVEAGRVVATLPRCRAISAAFDPTGRRFLVTSGPSGVQRWPIEWPNDPRPGVVRIGPPQQYRLPTGHGGEHVAFGGGTLAVSTDGIVAGVLDPDDPARPIRLLKDLPHGLWFVGINPSGEYVAAGSMNGYESVVWDAKTGVRLKGFPGRTARVAFSPDNRWLVIGTAAEYAFFEVGTWRPSGPALRRVYEGGLPGPMAFSRDGRVMAVAHSPRTIRLYDPTSRHELATFSAPEGELPEWLAFSPDGGRLAAGTGAGTIQLWDLRRIRALLGELGLDWDAPPLPPLAPDEGEPVSVEVDPEG